MLNMGKQVATATKRRRVSLPGMQEGPDCRPGARTCHEGILSLGTHKM